MNSNVNISGERASLLSGLRTAGLRSDGAGQQQQQQQHLQQMQYLQQQQQQQAQVEAQQAAFLQQLQFQQLQQLQQQQGQPQWLNNQQQQQQAQQAMFAFQQAQLELQMQQIQLANLAMQEQFLFQQQQQQQQAELPQAPRQPSPPTGTGRTQGQRSVSTSAAVPWTGNEHDAAARQERWGALKTLQQAQNSRKDGSVRSAAAGGNRDKDSASGSPSLGSTAGSAKRSVDWRADRLRNVSQPSAVTITSTSTSPPPDAAAAAAPGIAKPTPIVTSIDAANAAHRKTHSTASDASIQSLSISEAGSSFSPNRGPGIVLSSPGEESDDDEEMEGGEARGYGFPCKSDASPGGDPGSPSLHASMRAASIHERLAGAGHAGPDALATALEQEPANGKDGAVAATSTPPAAKERKSSRKTKHTLILSSSLPPFVVPGEAANKAGEAGSSTSISSSGSSSSSGSASPTLSDDRSEVASFESSATTALMGQSGSGSPTAATPAEKADRAESAAASRHAATEEVKSIMNAGATVFRPAAASATAAASAASSGTATPASAAAISGAGPRYPSSLALRSGLGSNVSPANGSSNATSNATPPSMRIFSAPPSTGASTSTPGGSVGMGAGAGLSVTRQPKGPVDEAELPTRNFAGMIRRKAVGALRIASMSGGAATGRMSPLASPVVPAGATFGIASPPQDHVSQYAGLGHGLPTSPTLPQGQSTNSAGFAAFGEHLAQRALQRRSAQFQQTQQQYLSQPVVGLGMY